MFRRDYFERMIEEAGQVLARLVGLREAQRPDEALRLLDEVYEAYFPFPRHLIIHTEPTDLPGLLQETHHVSEPQLTVLADLMREEAELSFQRGQWDKGQHLLRGALALHESLDAQRPDLYSFARVAKIEELRKRLDEDEEDL